MQGWRKSNEDAHITAPDIVPGVGLYAVFDGHGGVEVAKYVEKHFVRMLLEDENFIKKNYEQALKDTFVRIDKVLITPAGKKALDKIGKDHAPPGGY